MSDGNLVAAERDEHGLVEVLLETDGCEVAVTLSEMGARKLAIDLRHALAEGDQQRLADGGNSKNQSSGLTQRPTANESPSRPDGGQ